MPDDKITDADIEKFMAELADNARKDIIPKMRASAFCLTCLDGNEPDPYLALQVGIALLLDKPLIVLAIGDVWIPKRVRQLADVVITGPSVQDQATREKLQAAMEQMIRKRAKQ